MLFWGNLGCFQHGFYLQASSLQCAAGTGMLCVAAGSFKPYSAGEISWDYCNLDIQKPRSQMPPHRTVQLCRGRGSMEITCCTALACFCCRPAQPFPPFFLQILSYSARMEVVPGELQDDGVSTTDSSTSVIEKVP